MKNHVKVDSFYMFTFNYVKLLAKTTFCLSKGTAHVPKTAFRTDGMQPAVCLKSAQGTGKPVSRNTLQD